MGGIGSGRYCRWSKATPLESTLRIDIRYMRRNGLLRLGWSGTLRWSRNGGSVASISYKTFSDHLVFSYRNDGELVEQTVYLERTPCRFGGDRTWFRCPFCRRRCEVLAIAGKFPSCRKCYRLPYQSQCEDRLSRLFTREHKLEEVLWGESRKWYRRAKRLRLMAEYESLAAETEIGLYQRFGDYLSG